MEFKGPIQKEFKNEIYDKKKLTYGNRAKTSASGRRASFRGVRTQYDFMTKEERKNLNSEVIVSNLNDFILPKEQFDELSNERQKELLTHWRDLYENSFIMEGMGIKGSNTFHKYVKGLEIPKKKRGGNRLKNRKVATAVKKAPQRPIKKLEFEEPVHSITNTIQTALENSEIQQQPIIDLQAVEGLHLEYNGIYDAEQLSKIFTKLQLITDGESCKFKLNISLSERQK